MIEFKSLMIEFYILKQSKKSRARLGILKTPHGEVETPAFVPVGSQAVVKTLDSVETEESRSQILICNTFLLHVRPGEKIIRAAGGLHRFMHWSRPLMTDSGGFQVFSLGFGKDLGVGKIVKYFHEGKGKSRILKSSHPKQVKITNDGAYFRSPFDGKEIFLGPRESIKIQEMLGADIMFVFDECTPPFAEKAYIEKSLTRTHKWAKECLRARRSRAALFGIVQGSGFRDLREESARFLNNLDFDGFGIGGDLGKNKAEMKKILRWTIPHLTPEKPRHLLGIGHPRDMPIIAKEGIDLFDCTVPTHYARNGTAFTSQGKLSLRNLSYLKDRKPLDPKCQCRVCTTYQRDYITHLFRSREITALSLLTFHNLFFFNQTATDIREKIERGII